MPPIPPCPWWDCTNRAQVVVESYRVDTLIDRGVATTHVTEILRNDSDFTGQGEFLFPLPADAVVTGLTLWIDGEPVSGEVLDGDTARRTYEDIVRRTLDPALLEFVDDDLLRLSVFPMPADATRKVEIEYRQVLAADAGLVRYTTPMAREHDVAIERVSARIEIRGADPIKTITSPTHDVSIDRPDATTAIVGYEGSGRSPDEFVLYFSTDADPIALDVLTYREGGDGYFLLFASPGLAPATEIVPKDVVVVVDVSGSMEGEKIDQARDAARYVLAHLNPGDRFDVIAFSTTTDAWAGSLRPASEAGSASAWVAGLGAGGSTDIDLALREAVAEGDGEHPLYVVFLTDGLPTERVTDTATILEGLRSAAPPTTSLFSFGVGFDVDTFLLDSLARDHHGTTTYVAPEEAVDAAVESLYAKVSSPVLTGVTIAVDGVTISDVYPRPLPDVFSGGQLVAAGRYDAPGTATVTLTGTVAGEPTTLRFEGVDFASSGGDEAIPRLWATRKVGDLLRSVRLDGPNPEVIDQIVRLSIRWGIVTPYTSYLVDGDVPLGEQAIHDLSRSAADAAQAAPAPVTGSEAFLAATAAADLSGADTAAVPGSGFGDVVRLGGGRTFRLIDGVWTDTTFDPATMKPYDVPFGSEGYFALAADRSLAEALGVGTSVIVVHEGLAYRVVAPEASGDPLPATTTTTAGATTTSAPVLASGVDAPASRGPVALVAAAAAIGVALALALTALRRS
jgi:Ca-activated chloride channel family protein